MAALLAVFLAARSRGRASTLLLAAALACNYTIFYWPAPPWWLNSPQLYTPVWMLTAVVNAPALLIFAAFARQFRRETTSVEGRLVRLVLYGLAIVTAAMEVFLVAARLWFWLGDTVYAVISICKTALVLAGFVLAITILVLGRRDVAREQRGRFTLLMAAVVLTAAIHPLGNLGSLLDPDFTHPISVVVEATMMVCAVAGAFLFVYAILRHRVIDLGFAVNQTLIYGVVSFVVLLLFGLAEWGVEKIMPASWREHMEANGLISAGIALAIFLVFHRIRDGVEHVIEGVFFYKWRQNEALLDRFVKKASHILKPDALKAAAVAEFARFSGGAEVALYRADGTRLVRDAGELAGLDPTLDADLAPLVEMRAEGKPLYDDDAAPLHAALVLPMIQRNDLTGFIALGHKPSGDAYRPDERAVLAEAAQKIGLDLHALRIEELESELSNSRQQLQVTNARLDVALRSANLT